jgi:hypothetical protein
LLSKVHVRTGAAKYTDGTGELLGHDAGPLEGLEAHLQEVPLLRVEDVRLSLGNAEELRVKLLHPIELRGPPDEVRLAKRLPVDPGVQ